MTVKEAVVVRIKELCEQKGILPNALAVSAGVTPSTVYSLLDSNRNDASIITIKKLCDGLEIKLGEFFSSDVFDSLDQEVV